MTCAIAKEIINTGIVPCTVDMFALRSCAIGKNAGSITSTENPEMVSRKPQKITRPGWLMPLYLPSFIFSFIEADYV